MKKPTKEDLIAIAKAGFHERYTQLVNFENTEMHATSTVYRLFDKGQDYFLVLKQYHLAVHIEMIGDDVFVQFTTGVKAFNQLKAIKEMEKLGLL